MEREIKFPEGFYWGSATSAYQVEGGIENNDWASQSRNCDSVESLSRKAKSGFMPKGKSNIGTGTAGRATDHYHRYENDFDIAKLLGQNAHRFSIEWSRIEPEEGKFDELELEHYRRVLEALRARGLEPFVTLYHWTLPIWFAKRGSWLAKDSPQIFARFVEKMAGEYHGLVSHWITLNEPIVYASGSFLKGKWPPFRKNIFIFLRVIGKLIMSHNIAYQKIKNINPNAQVGIAKHNINWEADWNPFNKLIAKFLIWFWNRRFLDKISKSQDFIGLNYYFHHKFGGKKEYEKTDIGWEIYPKGIYNVLMELKKYHKPVCVTENGLADSKDLQREKFIKDHLFWISRAIQEGVDVRGYFYWSLTDNYEWDRGLKSRFGLVEINYDTLERHIRPSAYEYAKICKTNSLKPKT